MPAAMLKQVRRSEHAQVYGDVSAAVLAALCRGAGHDCTLAPRPAAPYLTVTEKFLDPKFMPPDDDVISKPYCTSPTTRSAIQPRFFR